MVAHLNLLMPAAVIISAASRHLWVFTCGRKRATSPIMPISVLMFSFTRCGYTTRAGVSKLSISLMVYQSAICLFKSNIFQTLRSCRLLNQLKQSLDLYRDIIRQRAHTYGAAHTNTVLLAPNAC